MTNALKYLYSITIDRTKFREVATRYVAFALPLIFWGKEPWWAGLYFVIAGVLIRTWAAGTLHKDQKMAFSGPYLFVRHPLYLGSCLLAIGMMVFYNHWAVYLFLGGITALTYNHQIRHEEENLIKTFGQSYRDYQKITGPLWPKPRGLMMLLSGKGSQNSYYSFAQYMKNREYELLLGIAAIIGVMLWSSKQ